MTIRRPFQDNHQHQKLLRGLFMDRVRLTETGLVLLFIMLDPMPEEASL